MFMDMLNIYLVIVLNLVEHTFVMNMAFHYFYLSWLVGGFRYELLYHSVGTIVHLLSRYFDCLDMLLH